MKTIKQQFLLKKVEGILERATQYASGTYNRQDPTPFSKSKIEFGGFVINLHDCGWGVEISIFLEGVIKPAKRGITRGNELASIYFSDGELIPRDNWNHKWFSLFDKINNNMPVLAQEDDNDFEYPMGHPSDYI